MKNILFPTDFSTSNFQGTCSFINDLLGAEYTPGLTFTFLHAHGKAVEIEDIEGTVGDIKTVFATRELEDEIKKINEVVRFPSDVNIKTSASTKSFSTAIHELDSEQDFDLVVVVLKKETFFQKIFKSKSDSPSRMVNDVKEPLLFMPAQSDVPKIEEVIICVDLKPFHNTEDWNYTIEFLKVFKPKIDFVYINTGNKEGAEERFKEVYAEQLKDFPFEYQFQEVFSNSPGKGIKDLVVEKEIDLAILIERKDDFLKSFLGDSVADELSSELEIPLYVISEKD